MNLTPEQLMAVRRFNVFSLGCCAIPLSIRTIRITSRGSADFAWQELRVFGFLVAMWGAMG
jgi:hypothetical protein